jgi:hypothetical protein
MTTAAAMANPTSTPLMAAGRGAGRGAAPARGAAAGVARGAAGVDGAAAGAAAEGVPAAVVAPVGAGAAGGLPPAAGAGILIVGAAVGFGGKLIRTVSFFGWTLAGSAGCGGAAPSGVFGVSSAIIFVAQTKIHEPECQIVILG